MATLHSSSDSSNSCMTDGQRALFIRIDRIGDLVLTLPVDEALASQFKLNAVQWWIPKGLSFVTNSSDPCRNAIEMPRKLNWKEFWSALNELRQQRYDAAIVFHAPWWVGLLLWLARIPLRVGVRSQWHSFLFFNRGVRQKRSRAEFSELEYNYQLVEQGLALPPGSLPRQSLRLRSLSGGERNQQQQLLEKFGLKEQEYFVVHPGMGGSALNWPIQHYATLIEQLSVDSIVAITGSSADEPYLAPLRNLLKNSHRNESTQPRFGKVIWLDQKLKGDELVTVLSGAKGIVAPSTGVLHLAASTRKKTVGIFSPVQVQQPRRWGPQGENCITVMPQVQCPGQFSCLGTACANYDCMANISVEQVLESLRPEK